MPWPSRNLEWSRKESLRSWHSSWIFQYILCSWDEYLLSFGNYNSSIESFIAYPLENLWCVNSLMIIISSYILHDYSSTWSTFLFFPSPSYQNTVSSSDVPCALFFGFFFSSYIYCLDTWNILLLSLPLDNLSPIYLWRFALWITFSW